MALTTTAEILKAWENAQKEGLIVDSASDPNRAIRSLQTGEAFYKERDEVLPPELVKELTKIGFYPAQKETMGSPKKDSAVEMHSTFRNTKP